MKTYTNTHDNGKDGRNFEVVLRYALTGKEEACHGLGKTDITIGVKGVTIEAKSGAGWLVYPCYESKEEAEALIEEGFKMSRATYVAYVPTFTGDPYEAIVLTQAAFLAVFSKHKKIRAKKSSSGLWGVALQSYVPTEKFKASVKTYEAILADLADNGMILEEFAEKYGLTLR